MWIVNTFTAYGDSISKQFFLLFSALLLSSADLETKGNLPERLRRELA